MQTGAGSHRKAQPVYELRQSAGSVRDHASKRLHNRRDARRTDSGRAPVSGLRTVEIRTWLHGEPGSRNPMTPMAAVLLFTLGRWGQIRSACCRESGGDRAIDFRIPVSSRSGFCRPRGGAHVAGLHSSRRGRSQMGSRKDAPPISRPRLFSDFKPVGRLVIGRISRRHSRNSNKHPAEEGKDLGASSADGFAKGFSQIAVLDQPPAKEHASRHTVCSDHSAQQSPLDSQSRLPIIGLPNLSRKDSRCRAMY
jgi:hypothetical protein